MTLPVTSNEPAVVAAEPIVSVFEPTARSLFNVSVPSTLKLLFTVTVADEGIVRLLNASVAELVMEEPLFIVIVPPEGEKLALVPTLKAPLMLKLLEVVTVAELAMVRLLKASVPPTVLTIEAPLFIVIVPEDGLKFDALLPSVSAPLIEKLLEVETVAPLAIVRALKVSVPEFTMDEPLFMVIVPLVGVNVPVAVNVPPTVALFPAPVIEPLTLKFP